MEKIHNNPTVPEWYIPVVMVMMFIFGAVIGLISCGCVSLI